jgi:putative membrane protein
VIAPVLAAAHPLATVNAVLNASAAVLLVAGWVCIRRGNVRGHRMAMVAAFVVSSVFLVSYLSRYALEGTHRFAGPDAVRPVYLAILATHVPLAAAVPLLALRMFFLAWRRRFDAHRRLGRITLPIWLYVSVTGVLIYFMLYRWFPGAAVGL